MLVGFVIGLGGVTVIDSLCLLGMRSGYWTQAVIRTHKVVQPIVAIALLLKFLGEYLTLQKTHDLRYQTLLFIDILIFLNALFLMFYASPYLQARERAGLSEKILPLRFQVRMAACFTLSFLCWWYSLYLFGQILNHP